MANKFNKNPTPKAVKQPVSNIASKNEQETKQRFSLNVKLAFLLGLISLIVYGNTLKNGYALDDYTVITENTIVTKGVSAISEILSTPYRRGYSKGTNDMYRPLSLVVFAIEYDASGGAPTLFHLINVLLYSGCVILLFLFLNKLFERKRTAVAFIASLLFALHPIHTEVVANIKSLDELLCFFFAFLSLNIFMIYMKNGKITQLLLGAFSLLLSLLSKESAITFLAVIPLIFFFYSNENKKRSVSITIISVMAAIIFLSVRFSVLNTYKANAISDISFMDNSLVGAPSQITRIATAILILGYYLRLLVIPYPLICDYSYNSIPFVHFDNIWVLLSLFIYISLAILSVKFFLRNHKDPFAFGILFFLITISLFTNIPFLIGTTMGERLMFFPSVGFCLLMALLIDMWLGKATEANIEILKAPKVLGVIIPVALIFVVITISRNADWLDNYTLYTTDIKKAANDARLNYYLGSELEKHIVPNEKDTAKQKQLQEQAIAYLNKAIAIFPDFKEAQSDLGATYFRKTQYDSAAVHMKHALQLDPTNIPAINNLATVYLFTKKYTEAIRLFNKALELDPNSVNAANWHYNTGCSFMNIRQFDSAVYHLNKLLALNSTYADANMQLGVCYFQIKKFDLAILCFKKALVLNPKDVNAAGNLALAYKIMDNLDSARKYEAIVQKNNPGFKL